MWLKIGQAFTANKADVFVLNNLTAFYDPLANKFGVTANTTTYTFTQYDVPFNTWIYVAFQVESSSGYVKLFVNKVQKDVYTGYPGDTNVPTMTIGGGHYGALGASVASIQVRKVSSLKHSMLTQFIALGFDYSKCLGRWILSHQLSKR